MNQQKIQALIRIQELLKFKTLDELDKYIENIRDEYSFVQEFTPEGEQYLWERLLVMSDKDLKLLNGIYE